MKIEAMKHLTYQSTGFHCYPVLDSASRSNSFNSPHGDVHYFMDIARMKSVVYFFKICVRKHRRSFFIDVSTNLQLLFELLG